MTPLALGASAAASQATAAGSSAPAGNAAGKEPGGFDTLLHAAPQPPPRAKPAEKPAPQPQGQASDDPVAAPAKSAEAAEATEESMASDAGKAPAPAAADSSRDDTDTDELPWPPPGLSGLLPVAAPVPAPLAAAPVATAGGDPPAPAGAPIPAAALPGMAPQSAIQQTPTATQPAAATDTDALAQLASLETAALPRAGGDSPVPATDPAAGAALFGPLLHNLAAMADARPAAALPPALAAPVDPQAADFDDALGARVGWLAEQKIGHAHIRVTPNELGPVEVKLQLDGDRVHASFSSAHAEVRQALENGLPRLREMLGEQGLQLAHADVGQQSAHPQASGGDGQPAGNGTGTGTDADGTGAPATPGVHAIRLRGLLDAYA